MTPPPRPKGLDLCLHLLGKGHYLVRGTVQVLRCQEVAHSVREQPFFLVPPAGSPVQLGHQFRVLPVETLPQQIGKEAMVAVPASFLIQWHDEQVVGFE